MPSWTPRASQPTGTSARRNNANSASTTPGRTTLKTARPPTLPLLSRTLRNPPTVATRYRQLRPTHHLRLTRHRRIRPASPRRLLKVKSRLTAPRVPKAACSRRSTVPRRRPTRSRPMSLRPLRHPPGTRTRRRLSRTPTRTSAKPTARTTTAVSKTPPERTPTPPMCRSPTPPMGRSPTPPMGRSPTPTRPARSPPTPRRPRTAALRTPPRHSRLRPLRMTVPPMRTLRALMRKPVRRPMPMNRHPPSTSMRAVADLEVGADGLARPPWAAGEGLLREYYDTEWGMPVRDERGMYERLTLETFQAGLSWALILRKRPAFREAFCQFDPEKVGAFSERDIARLLQNEEIVRNRAKILAAITNARATISLR